MEECRLVEDLRNAPDGGWGVLGSTNRSVRSVQALMSVPFEVPREISTITFCQEIGLLPKSQDCDAHLNFRFLLRQSLAMASTFLLHRSVAFSNSLVTSRPARCCCCSLTTGLGLPWRFARLVPILCLEGISTLWGEEVGIPVGV
jgi:hypothetical protein